MVNFSIIIPTLNRDIILRNTLKAISELEYEVIDFEVIVIDNGSTDNTKEICAKFSKVIPNFRYIHQKEIGLHNCRNLALNEAKGEVLCYLDDDVYVFKSWMKGIRKSFSDKEVGLVGGKNLPKYEITPPEWIINLWNSKRIIGYLSVLDLGDEEKEIDPIYVYGCNFSVRKNIVLEAGGFHPDGFPKKLIRFRGDGESYISNYIKENKYKAIYNPLVSIYHFVSKERVTRKYFNRRAFYQGISDSFTFIRRVKGNNLQILNNLIKTILNLLMKIFRSNIKYYLLYYYKGIIYHHVYCIINRSFKEYVLRINYLIITNKNV